MKTPPLKRFSCALALFGCTAFSPAAAFGDFSFGDVDDIDDAVRLELGELLAPTEAENGG